MSTAASGNGGELVAAELTTVFRITVGSLDVVKRNATGGENHVYALLVAALAALAMTLLAPARRLANAQANAGPRLVLEIVAPPARPSRHCAARGSHRSVRPRGCRRLTPRRIGSRSPRRGYGRAL